MRLPAKLPEGFRWVTVPVTESEFQRLKKKAALSPTGTTWEGLRQKAQLPGVPYGLQAALVRKGDSDTR